MNIIFILIPLGLVLLGIAVAAFFWAVRSGQYDDLESPAWKILFDDDRTPSDNLAGKILFDDDQTPPEVSAGKILLDDDQAPPDPSRSSIPSEDSCIAAKRPKPSK